MAAYNYSNRLFRKTKTISITSGKGGVGKSTLICNLAIDLRNQGFRVLILDGDMGMANIDIMFGKKAPHNLMDLFTSQKDIEDIVTPVSSNIDLIAGGSGIYELQNLDVYQKKSILDQVDLLAGEYDYLLIDTAPGIADNVLYLNAAADETLVVLTPNPSSLTDAYALMKVLYQRCKKTDFSVICNMVRDEREALACYQRVCNVADQFLNIRINYRGFVPVDPQLTRATKAQQLILEVQPRCPSSFAIKHIGSKLSQINHIGESKGGLQVFWHQLVGSI